MSDIKSRKLNEELIHKFKIEHSPYDKLLKYIAIDSALRFEIHEGGKAQILYKTCVALTIGARSFSVNKKYFLKGRPEALDSKLKIVINNPREFFQIMKREIDNYTTTKGYNKLLCSAHHKIAAFNQLKSDRYLVSAMQYEILQKNLIDKKNNNTYDIVAVDQRMCNVIIFKVIYGIQNIVEELWDGIQDFERNFRKSEYKNTFARILEADIKNIIEDKNSLGILNNCSLPENFRVANAAHVEFKFVIAIDPEIDRTYQMIEYNKIAEQAGIPSYYQAIFADVDDIPKLQ